MATSTATNEPLTAEGSPVRARRRSRQRGALTDEQRARLARWQARPREEDDWPGLVYLVGAYEAEELRYIKIGYTANPLEERIASMQTGCPLFLRLIVATQGSEDLERHWHEEFARHRVHGEWFRPHADLIVRAEGIELSNGGFDALDGDFRAGLETTP